MSSTSQYSSSSYFKPVDPTLSVSSSSSFPVPLTSRLQRFSGLFALFLGGSSLILLTVWLREFEGGFSTSPSSAHFNLHPLGMMLGYPLALLHGILAWRLYQIHSHNLLKSIHVISNVIASGFIVFGLWSIITIHSSPHLLSVHSWLGVCTAGLTALQLLIALILYLTPGVPIAWRLSCLPYHALFGQLVLICGILTILSGLTNFLSLNAKTIKFNSREMIIGNSVGIIVFACLLFALFALLPRRKLEEEREIAEGGTNTNY
jgi:hypothetical protein